MPEIPSGYLPDYRVQPVPAFSNDFKTAISRAKSGRQQRRRRKLPQRYWGTETIPLPQADRKVVYDFLVSKEGAHLAFYFFNPAPETVASFNCGTVSSATSIILPWKGPWWVGNTPVAATLVGTPTVNGVLCTNPVLTPNIGSGGEDRLSWTGLMGGPVLVSAQLVRLRVVVHNLDDKIHQRFVPEAADVLAAFPLQLEELV